MILISERLAQNKVPRKVEAMNLLKAANRIELMASYGQGVRPNSPETAGFGATTGRQPAQNTPLPAKTLENGLN